MSEQIPPPDMGCHHTAFKKKCRELVGSGLCRRWMLVTGKNPQSMEVINRWDCVDNWGPLLQIEASQMQRHTTASIDKSVNEARGFRNDMRRANGMEELPTGTEPSRPALPNDPTKFISGPNGEQQ